MTILGPGSELTWAFILCHEPKKTLNFLSWDSVVSISGSNDSSLRDLSVISVFFSQLPSFLPSEYRLVLSTRRLSPTWHDDVWSWNDATASSGTLAQLSAIWQPSQMPGKKNNGSMVFFWYFTMYKGCIRTRSVEATVHIIICSIHRGLFGKSSRFIRSYCIYSFDLVHHDQMT